MHKKYKTTPLPLTNFKNFLLNATETQHIHKNLTFNSKNSEPKFTKLLIFTLYCSYFLLSPLYQPQVEPPKSFLTPNPG